MGVLDALVRSGCRHAASQFTGTSAAILGTTAGLFNPQLQQVRYGKRKGVKQAKLAKLKKQGLLPDKKKELKPSVEPIAKKGSKNKVPLHLTYPARPVDDDRPAVPGNLADNVLLAFKYKQPVRSLSDALAMHREQMAPDVFNNPTAPVRLRLDLNLNTEKKRRFVHARRQVVQLPHMFPQSAKRIVLAFTDDVVLQPAAKQAGADVVAGSELIKKIVKGTFRTDDYDFIVADENVGNLVSIRHLVKEKFPTVANGCVGPDIVALVEHVLTGVELNVQQDEALPQYGLCDVIVGTLDMPDEHLEANIQTVFDELAKIRPSTKKLGHFVDRSLVMLKAHGPDEYFAIDHLHYLPLSTEKGAKVDEDQVFDEPEPEPEQAEA